MRFGARTGRGGAFWRFPVRQQLRLRQSSRALARQAARRSRGSAETQRARSRGRDASAGSHHRWHSAADGGHDRAPAALYARERRVRHSQRRRVFQPADLMGPTSDFRVDAGDLPEFSLYLPGHGGNLKLGIISTRGVQSKWASERGRGHRAVPTGQNDLRDSRRAARQRDAFGQNC